MKVKARTVSRSDAYREAWSRDLDPSVVGETHRSRFVDGADHAINGGDLGPAANEWFAAGFRWAHRENRVPPTE